MSRRPAGDRVRLRRRHRQQRAASPQPFSRRSPRRHRADRGRVLRALSGLRRCGDVRGAGAGSRHRDERCARDGAGGAQGRAHAGACCARDRCCFPARLEFIREAAAAVPIAIASGALRHEIDEVIDAAGVAICSRPSWRPATRRRASRRPRRTGSRSSGCASRPGRDLDPRRCVAIEDSRWGLESRTGAGSALVGVTNSYPAARADRRRAGRRRPRRR